jgi:hypothetical protein
MEELIIDSAKALLVQRRRIDAIEGRQDDMDRTATKALTIAEQVQRHVEIAGPRDDSQYSMSAYCGFRGANWNIDTLKMLGFRASKLCREQGMLTSKTKHDRFNTVNTYPVDILEEIFNEFVAELETYAS